MKLKISCPAKINTFLSVGPPGAGGYHPIRTHFQAVGLFDDLIVERSEKAEISCEGFNLPPENTLSRTIRLMAEIYPVPSLNIHLVKRIPAESGLGGGSSDAAGLIRAIAFMLNLAIDQHLVDVASSVGKDVPFFLVGGRAKGEGLGDKVTPLDDQSARWLLLTRPSEGVSSAAGYQRLDEVKRPFADFPANFWTLYNDFERIAPCACGELAERLQMAGARGAGMTGSGSAVFGWFDDQESALRAEARLKAESSDLWTAVVPTLNRTDSIKLERLH